VVVDSVSLKVIYIICSVLQGSVLGPVIFILYQADLTHIIVEHSIALHAYADDNQLYIHCQPKYAQTCTTVRLSNRAVDGCQPTPTPI